jgi:hypothetical protein
MIHRGETIRRWTGAGPLGTEGIGGEGAPAVFLRKIVGG